MHAASTEDIDKGEVGRHSRFLQKLRYWLVLPPSLSSCGPGKVPSLNPRSRKLAWPLALLQKRRTNDAPLTLRMLPQMTAAGEVQQRPSEPVSRTLHVRLRRVGESSTGSRREGRRQKFSAAMSTPTSERQGAGKTRSTQRPTDSGPE